MEPRLKVLVLILCGILATLEVGFVLQCHFEWCGPRLRRRFGLSPEMPISGWHVVFFGGGLIAGMHVWTVLTRHLDLYVLVDYAGKLIGMGMGGILSLALFDGWRLFRELRR